jgi:hypothetical protein
MKAFSAVHNCFLLTMNNPGQVLRFPEGFSSPFSKQSAHERGKFVSPTHRPQRGRMNYVNEIFKLH